MATFRSKHVSSSSPQLGLRFYAGNLISNLNIYIFLPFLWIYVFYFHCNLHLELPILHQKNWIPETWNLQAKIRLFFPEPELFWGFQATEKATSKESNTLKRYIILMKTITYQAKRIDECLWIHVWYDNSVAVQGKKHYLKTGQHQLIFGSVGSANILDNLC